MNLGVHKVDTSRGSNEDRCDERCEDWGRKTTNTQDLMLATWQDKEGI